MVSLLINETWTQIWTIITIHMRLKDHLHHSKVKTTTIINLDHPLVMVNMVPINKIKTTLVDRHKAHLPDNSNLFIQTWCQWCLNKIIEWLLKMVAFLEWVACLKECPHLHQICLLHRLLHNKTTICKKNEIWLLKKELTLKKQIEFIRIITVYYFPIINFNLRFNRGFCFFKLFIKVIKVH